MDYLVIGEDGTEYGPVNLQTIVKWVAEGRVQAQTNLKNFQTGVIAQAGSIAVLFPPVLAPPISTPRSPGPPIGESNPYAQASSNYPRGSQPAVSMGRNGTSDVWWSLGRSVVAVVFAVLQPGAGLFVAAFGVWRGVRAYKAGHRLGLAALIISIVAMVIVGALFFYRIMNPVHYRGYDSGPSQP
jgi:hypothetical protein